MFMIDLETLGTNPSAPIVQIGLVQFGPQGSIYDKLELNIQPNLTHADFATIQWWMKQSAEARKLFDLPGIQEWEAISILNSYLNKEEDIWCHASFDMPILTSMFHRNNSKMNVDHRKIRDIRTLELFVKDKPERKGIHHTAIDDCLYQIEYVVHALEVLCK